MFLGSGKLTAIAFHEVRPDGRHNWIDRTHNNYDLLLPIASKET